MSQSAKQLLIIYEAEAEQWASYLRSVFTGPIPASGICCYDITGGSGRDEPVLRPFACKLVILSKGLVEALSQRLRALLARVLSPAAGVVVLLCGVDSLTPLLELVPLDANECLQVSSEQDANEYLSAVTDVVRKGVGSPSADLNPVACGGSGSVLVVPSRVLCGSCVEVFVLLKSRAVGGDAQLEFSGGNHTLSVTPARWNERTLRVSAPDFAAGRVTVTVLSDGAALGSAALQYCSSTEELGHILSRLMDPVQLMCEALQVSSVEKLDQRLASMLLEAMPGEGVQGLRWPEQPQTELQREDLPSLLHFAAQFGLRRVARLLLQVPGAARALHAADRRGRTPAEVAREHGHAQLHALLKETPKVSNVSEDRSDAGVYEIMCTADVQKEQRGEEEEEQEEEEEEEEEQEELYTPLGGDDEYDTIVKAVDIANRPPAPTPRPESTALQDRTPFIAQVFQKKTAPQAGADLYSLPTKQARGRGDAVSSTYDAAGPRVKAASEDEAQRRLGSWPRAQRSTCSQQEAPSQRRAGSVSSGDGVYDKINVVHHSPSAAAEKNRRRNKSVESDFYSTPLKGQHANFFWKADKR